jgi:hypothetical protein
MSKVIIARSQDEKVLERLRTSLGYEGMSIYVSHTSRLEMELKDWKKFSEEAKNYIDNFSKGFIAGWEMAKE